MARNRSARYGGVYWLVREQDRREEV